MTKRVLAVDDDLEMRSLVTAGLGRRGFEVVSAASAEAALEVCGSVDFDVVVVDHRMPGTTGVELCRRMVENRPDVPIVVVTAFGSLDTAVAAIRAGAYDFLTKPFEMEALVLVLERALQHKALRQEVRRLRQAVLETRGLGNLLGQSPVIRRLFDLVERASESDATVLISGESGTGKDLVAHALHNRGSRRQGSFVAINCAALSEALLESELFGHKRGSFTDAKETRGGLLVEAKGGTVFLDEIGDMPAGMQAKLLRAIESRVIRPVGSDSEVPIDVRFLAATHRDLESDVEEGRFRQDLYFRINVIRIEVPPLRARGNDVLLLGQSFLDATAARTGKAVLGFTPAAAEKLLAYPWPGNVRELYNAVERAAALTSFDHISPEDLPEHVRNHQPSEVVLAGDPASLLPMDEVERRYVLHVLAATGGNKTLAARILGFDRRTMYRKLARYGVAEN